MIRADRGMRVVDLVVVGCVHPHTYRERVHEHSVKLVAKRVSSGMSWRLSCLIGHRNDG
jgi:hypothetical protein